MNNFIRLIALSLIGFWSYGQTTCVDFSASDTQICVGESISFTDISTCSGSVTSWLWDFGDGNQTNTQNPTHTYTLPGTYTVALSLPGTGETDRVRVGFITVFANPVPSFSVSNLCSTSESPVFTDVQPSGAGISYNWDFDNGQTSTDQNPTGIVFNEGSYTIELTVIDANGCEGSVTQPLVVNNYQADFDFPAPICEGTAVTFSDLSDPGTNSWSWSFEGGNPATSTQQNPSVVFANEGTYNVTLTAGNSTIGCSDVLTVPVTVLPNPTPAFSADVTNGCSPLEVTFTNDSPGTYTDVFWNFGDGSTGSGDPVTHTYTSDGSYNVTMAVVNANGCVNEITINNMIVLEPIEARFTATPRDGCEPLEVNFNSGTSISPAGEPIVSWEWDFGNGETSTDQNPMNIEYMFGVYDVTLTVTTAGGCTHTLTLPEFIEVGIELEIDFVVDKLEDCAKTDWEFSAEWSFPVGVDPNSYDVDEEDFDWSWQFGDGESGSEQETTHNYPIEVDSMDVELTLTYRGCETVLEKENFLYVLAPIALFSTAENSPFCSPGFFDTGDFPLVINFNDDATLYNEENTGDDVQVYWWFGDTPNTPENGIATAQVVFDSNTDNDFMTDDDQTSVSHAYNNYGVYNVYQLVNNNTTGCADTFDLQIIISDVVADFEFSDDRNIVCLNEEFNVSSTSTSASDDISSFSVSNFRWEFERPNGSFQLVSNTTSPNYTYTTPGTYTIRLTVINPNSGCQNTISKQVQVLNRPVVSFTSDDGILGGCSPFDVTFVNNSSSIDGVNLVQFDWIFEDNSTAQTTSLAETVSYEFEGVGNYITTLLVTDEFGCTNSGTVTVQVTQPTAQVNAPIAVCEGEQFTIFNTTLTTQPTDTYTSQWFLNGVDVSTSTNWTSTLFNSNPGTPFEEYEVRLFVEDQNGCTDETTFTLIVSTPIANFDYSFTGLNPGADEDVWTCPSVTALHTDLSLTHPDIDIATWNWSWTNGNASTLQNPSNLYSFAGVYSASLIITDEFGCTSSIDFPDYLTIGGPVGQAEWFNIGTFCDPLYEFTSFDLENTVDVVWDMGDGTIINNMETFSYAYSEPGVYTPLATLIDLNGCNVPLPQDPINAVFATVNASFSISETSVDMGETVVITDNSSASSGIIDWSWDTGIEEFNLDNGNPFEYVWQIPGDYDVMLIVTDDDGCQDTAFVFIMVLPEVIVPNVFTANGDGVNDIFKLRNPAFQSFDLVIINRWGNVVSEGRDMTGTYLWDGRNVDGTPCTEGVYFYKIDGILFDDEPYSTNGFVTLVRDNPGKNMGGN